MATIPVVTSQVVSVEVNGTTYEREVEARRLLIHFLRDDLDLTGSHVGCDTGNCGACTVHLDGTAVRSCAMPVSSAHGAKVTTIEGLAPSGSLHPLQQAWIDVQVPHCGYCQNGMMIQAADLLATTKRPTEAQIRTAMNGHLCRCGTYPRILTAIQKAAAVMAKGGK